MKWEKCGVVWSPRGELAWAQSHATLPVAHVTGPDRWCVYVGCRDAAGKTRIARLTLDTNRLPQGLPSVCCVDPEPILPLGEPGTFDDSGMMPSWLVQDDGSLRLYYIGWNVIGTVPYRLSIGLAISDDRGVTFRRHSQGPVFDRSSQEPYFVTAPCVHKEHDTWRMWYVSCTGWQEIAGRFEPAYHVKYAESPDGLVWNPLGLSCIDAGANVAVAHPCVFRNADHYGMIYPYRSLANYRSDPASAYRLGYAESNDGLRWQRMDDRVGIERSAAGWDSEMMEYCWLQRDGNEAYLLYNGSGFGRTGFGLARLVSWD